MGFIAALMQGGVFRRFAPIYGAKPLAIGGFHRVGDAADKIVHVDWAKAQAAASMNASRISQRTRGPSTRTPPMTQPPRTSLLTDHRPTPIPATAARFAPNGTGHVLSGMLTGRPVTTGTLRRTGSFCRTL